MQERPNCFSRNGLTYASLNGREVCPDLYITHADVKPDQAALQLARLRAQAHSASIGPDLEWDPPGPEEVIFE